MAIVALGQNCPRKVHWKVAAPTLAIRKQNQWQQQRPLSIEN
jgi:hypothetical protein